VLSSANDNSRPNTARCPKTELRSLIGNSCFGDSANFDMRSESRKSLAASGAFGEDMSDCFVNNSIEFCFLTDGFDSHILTCHHPFTAARNPCSGVISHRRAPLVDPRIRDKIRSKSSKPFWTWGLRNASRNLGNAPTATSHSRSQLRLAERGDSCRCHHMLARHFNVVPCIRKPLRIRRSLRNSLRALLFKFSFGLTVPPVYCGRPRK